MNRRHPSTGNPTPPPPSRSEPGHPFSPAVFHILLCLADGEKHGYAIMQDVESTTSGSLRLGPGTLYGAIKRLLATGWIHESDERPDERSPDRRRRYYQLTATGQAALDVEARRLEQLVELARRRTVHPPYNAQPA